MLRSLLQGKPFHTALHPILVNFPIGLFLLSLFLDLIDRLGWSSVSLNQAAYYTILAGLITALLAILTGFVDWYDIRRDHPAKPRATTHMLLNLLVTGFFLVSALLRRGDLDAPLAPLTALALSFLGGAVVLYSGYLGGSLVYDQGIAVGRHRRHTSTPPDTIELNSREARNGYLEVAGFNSLEEGQTLRVSLDGNVMTIIRYGDQAYAVQEFCTHRYGPLSEGCLDAEGSIVCPWHRSAFDVRTGKVTQGPAKVDLKIYPVEVRDGKIVLVVPNSS